MYSLTLWVKTIGIYAKRTFPLEALTLACYHSSILKETVEGLCIYSSLFLVQHHSMCTKQVSAGIRAHCVCIQQRSCVLSQAWTSKCQNV